ncbi:cytochrome c [Alsobacter sp. SYSU M60028]|uniref:Cytochrome c n=1 Tax=Alsobacter ponti TaxID=2962936 RepID=A0ABT1LFT1_9HYPH|nr:cytochrome c [Alsobacter ponti]MCP8940351.1 cytochrome c [Alsobacter ponti]
MRKAGLFVTAIFAALAPLHASAQVPAQTPVPPPSEQNVRGVPPKPSAARGKVVAQRWCAECHVVAPEQKTAKADVPPFSAIAERGRNGSSVPLETFLMNPHPRMPDMQLTRNEVADLVAYIRSQRSK